MVYENILVHVVITLYISFAVGAVIKMHEKKNGKVGYIVAAFMPLFSFIIIPIAMPILITINYSKINENNKYGKGTMLLAIIVSPLFTIVCYPSFVVSMANSISKALLLCKDKELESESCNYKVRFNPCYTVQQNYFTTFEKSFRHRYV